MPVGAATGGGGTDPGDFGAGVGWSTDGLPVTRHRRRLGVLRRTDCRGTRGRRDGTTGDRHNAEKYNGQANRKRQSAIPGPPHVSPERVRYSPRQTRRISFKSACSVPRKSAYPHQLDNASGRSGNRALSERLRSHKEPPATLAFFKSVVAEIAVFAEEFRSRRWPRVPMFEGSPRSVRQLGADDRGGHPPLAGERSRRRAGAAARPRVRDPDDAPGRHLMPPRWER